MAPTKAYYIYTLSDEDEIFYVGKGMDRRVHNHETEARRGCECLKCDRIRAVWAAGRQVVKTLVFRTEDEQEAYNQERALIIRMGRGKLVNKTWGGGGARKYPAPLPDGYISFDDLRKQMYAEIEERIKDVSPFLEKYWRMQWRGEEDKKIRRLKDEAAVIEKGKRGSVKYWFPEVKDK